MSDRAAPLPEGMRPEANDESLGEFFENAPLGLHFVGPDGTILRANRAELVMLGYEADEYVGKNIADFYVDPQAAADVMHRLRSGHELHEFETAMRCKDGSIKHVSLTSNGRFEDGRFIHARCFTRDITGQQRAAELATLLSSIVESSNDVIVSKTLDGTITSWNTSAERTFGYTADEAIGQSIRMIVPDDRQAEEDEVLRRLAKGERVEHFETERRRKDGTIVTMSLTISPIIDAQGRVIGASKVGRDITGQKQLEEELRRSLSARDDFLGLVSHELRTPLTTLKGTANVLRRRQQSINDDDRAQALEDIELGADRLLRIVENMLTLARVEGAAPDELEPVLLSRVLGRFIAEQQLQFIGHPISFRDEVGSVPVLGSEAYIRLIVGNLLSNARKYSPAGTEISVSTRTEGTFAEVQVADAGMGLNEDGLDEVFEPFFRTRQAAERATGIGLGLTVCKRLVEAQGGSIHAFRRPGGGSVFAFTLPLMAEAHVRERGASDR